MNRKGEAKSYFRFLAFSFSTPRSRAKIDQHTTRLWAEKCRAKRWPPFYRGRDRCCQWPPHRSVLVRMTSYGSCLESGEKAFTGIRTMNREPAGLPSPSALVSEPREVKSFRTPFTASVTAFCRVLAIFDQSSLALVQLQAESCRTYLKILQARFRVVQAFEANHKVIRVANNICI